MIERLDNDNGIMYPHEDGDWVRYEDHVSELAEKNKEIERLKKSVRTWYPATDCALINTIDKKEKP